MRTCSTRTPVAQQRRLPVRINPPACATGIADACAHLFRACRDLQRAKAGSDVDILFDVEPVELPVAIADALSLMVRAVINDVTMAPRQTSDGTVSVGLRHVGSRHLLTLEDRGFRNYPDSGIVTPPRIVDLAASLNAVWRVSAIGDRRTIAVAFALRRTDDPAHP